MNILLWIVALIISVYPAFVAPADLVSVDGERDVVVIRAIIKEYKKRSDSKSELLQNKEALHQSIVQQEEQYPAGKEQFWKDLRAEVSTRVACGDVSLGGLEHFCNVHGTKDVLMNTFTVESAASIMTQLQELSCRKESRDFWLELRERVKQTFEQKRTEEKKVYEGLYALEHLCNCKLNSEVKKWGIALYGDFRELSPAKKKMKSKRLL